VTPSVTSRPLFAAVQIDQRGDQEVLIALLVIIYAAVVLVLIAVSVIVIVKLGAIVGVGLSADIFAGSIDCRE